VQVSVDFEAWMNSAGKEALSEGMYEMLAKVTVNGDVKCNDELMIRLYVTKITEVIEE